MYERCCGLDVHKKNVVACALTPEGKEVRTFSTMTGALHELVVWLKEKGCTHVAMESTGVLWKPLFNLIELEEIEPLVVNAQHIKAVPGRKTDVKDSEWIATLLKHGLLRGSYIPHREQRELRELIRYRRSLIEERSREINRVQKVLEGANIKLSSVASNVLGVSGRAMLEAMISGEENPEVLADLAKRRLKNKKADLIEALQGVMGDHQRFMLKMQLRHIDDLDRDIEELNAEIQKRMNDHEDDIARLITIPGIGRQTAEMILAEVGYDVKNQFGSASRLCAWAGVAPGNKESGGKRKKAKTRQGSEKLTSALVEAGQAAGRSKDTYLSAFYRRIAARRGKKRAAMATGHRILTIVYHLLVNKENYRELGHEYYDQRQREVIIKQSLKRLEKLGVQVTVA